MMKLTKEFLFYEYVACLKTAEQIAHNNGYRSGQTILNALTKHGIKIRSGRDAQHPLNIGRTILEDFYIDKKLSCDTIAKELDCASETIRRLLIKHNVPIREKTCIIRQYNIGKQLANDQKIAISNTRKELYANGKLRHWHLGGTWNEDVRNKISKTLLDGRTPSESDYGADWHIQRTSCLQRDNHTCQQCESVLNLEVHHWRPYRFCFDNSLENLITLCFLCHREIHALYRREGFVQEAEETFYV